jgi:hypothetical protein
MVFVFRYAINFLGKDSCLQSVDWWKAVRVNSVSICKRKKVPFPIQYF